MNNKNKASPQRGEERLLSQRHSISRPRQPSPQNTVVDPKQYADAVRSYSQLSGKNSLYAGTHFENLASYLQRPYQELAPNRYAHISSNNQHDVQEFVSIYDLSPNAPLQASQFKNPEHLDLSVLEASSSKLIFMRGLPSPEWLGSIGAKFHVDPEFFQRHLDFNEGLPPHFVEPSLPSANMATLRLRVTTIGFPRTRPSTTFSPDAVRRESAEIMDKYRQQLKSQDRWKAGDSIIRDINVYDPHNFTIEQDISILIYRRPESWIVLVWLDLGENLSDILHRWMNSRLRVLSPESSCLPVVRSKPRTFLSNRGHQTPAHLESRGATTSMYQSASWLHVNYGQSLNRSLMGKNPFYAIHEIFAFVASSENQFLNMLESKIVKELDPLSLVEQKSPTLSNLLYSQQALDRHIQRIRENIAFICRFVPTGEPNGPAYDDLEDEAATCGKEILHDYEYLLTRAMAISEKCNRGMQVVMNNASIEESRKAINQAEGVAILTRLAFVFMPLNYVSAVFGMNFSQFGQGPLSLWIWPAVSIPVLLISIVLVRTNVIDTFRRSFRSNGDLQN